MGNELDKTKFKTEVWENSGVWWAKVSADYEDEGTLEEGGTYYKRAQTQKVRTFGEDERAAREWAEAVEANSRKAVGATGVEPAIA